MRLYAEALRARGFSDKYDQRCRPSNGSSNRSAVYVVTMEYIMINVPQFLRYFKELILDSFNFIGRHSRLNSYFEFPADGEILSGSFDSLYGEHFFIELPRHKKSRVLFLPEHRNDKLGKFLETAAKNPKAQSQSFALK